MIFSVLKEKFRWSGKFALHYVPLLESRVDKHVAPDESPLFLSPLSPQEGVGSSFFACIWWSGRHKAWDRPFKKKFPQLGLSWGFEALKSRLPCLLGDGCVICTERPLHTPETWIHFSLTWYLLVCQLGDKCPHGKGSEKPWGKETCLIPQQFSKYVHHVLKKFFFDGNTC